MHQPPQAQKILVIKLRAIGDVLLSTVVLADLHAAYPAAQIDMLTERLSGDVLAGNPELSSVIVFDAKRESSFSLLRRIRRRRYDLVIDLFGNPRSALIALGSGAGVRVGYRFGWRRWCYTNVIEPRGGEVHNTEFNLDALRALGIPIRSRTVTFPIDADADGRAERFFRESGLDGRFVVALNPGGGWSSKRWGARQYAALGEMLAGEWNAEVVVLWGPGEREEAEAIRSAMPRSCHLIPPSSLKELAAILRRCSLLVTNDSGPMHIAAAIGMPVVALFGPTRPELQGPFDTPHVIVQNHRLLCLGCNLTICPIGNPCMTELSPLEVAEACRAFADRNHLLQEQGMIT